MKTIVRPIREWPLWNQLFLLLSLLNFLDYWSTNLIITKYGYDMEANPVMRWLMYYADTPLALLFAKIVVISAVWYWVDTKLRATSQKGQRRIVAMLFAMNALFFVVVVANFITYYQL